ncbi:MAG: alkaline phosphatase PhoX [Bryobacteraceae bacterium]
MPLTRRHFLATPASGLFAGMSARAANAYRQGKSVTSPGYGELRPAGDVFSLPPGFQYSVISFEGDRMADGFPVPSAMDGMDALPLSNGNILLIRNHEINEAGNRFRPRPAGSTSTTAGTAAHLLDTEYGPRRFAYDEFSGGGTTSIEVNPRSRQKVSEYWSLVGTLRNCAGGSTPWGSWLTCEETLLSATATDFAQNHGYVFEVPVTTTPGVPAPPTPLRSLGRFSHEAVAVDPATGIIYETEDQGDVSGFYRYLPANKPAKPGDLASDRGELQMLKVNTADRYVTCINQRTGVALPVSWVPVPNPDPTPVSVMIGAATASATFQQGLNAGGAIFRRLEGSWYSQGKIYFTSTNGGEVGLGQIWVYDPGASTITMVFETPDLHVLDFPDNITVSPRGGLLVCEDGGNGQHLRGVTPSGEIFDFARNIFNSIEMAGACYSPDGQTLFVNMYGRATIRTSTRYGTTTVINIGSEIAEKALTVAIWGPWGQGLL